MNYATSYEPALERVWIKSGEIEDANDPQLSSILFQFYHDVIEGIRTVDHKTLIILDSSAHSSPIAFKKMQPQKDKYVLYSFHMYDPYAYTNNRINGGKFRYPGQIINGQLWNKKTLMACMKNVMVFQQTYSVPNNRILVGEFGGHRTSKRLECYFKDLIDIFKQNGWHFAFYAFREDTWSGMDYELGDRKLPWNYRQIRPDRVDSVLPDHKMPLAFKVLMDD